MKTTSNSEARSLQQQQALDELARFLHYERSTAEMLEDAATAQAQIFHLINICDPEQKDDVFTAEIGTHFYFITQLLGIVRQLEQ